MNDAGDREYEYGLKWAVIWATAAFFGACAVVMAFTASSNQRGLVINGIFHLETSGATTFYWILFAASVGFVALAGLLAYHRLALRQTIVLGANAITVPASRFSRATKAIPYRDIQTLSIQSVGKQRFLVIEHASGKHTITASMLPSEVAFDEVLQHVRMRSA